MELRPLVIGIFDQFLMNPPINLRTEGTTAKSYTRSLLTSEPENNIEYFEIL